MVHMPAQPADLDLFVFKLKKVCPFHGDNGQQGC